MNEQSRKKKEYANICGNGGGGGGDGRDKMDQSAAFRKVRVKSVQKRKTEKEKEIKGIDSKEEKKYNVTSRHRHTIGDTQDQASLEWGVSKHIKLDRGLD